jgi:hypothetical protein
MMEDFEFPGSYAMRYGNQIRSTCAVLWGGVGLSREEGSAEPGVNVGAGMGVMADWGS